MFVELRFGFVMFKCWLRLSHSAKGELCENRTLRGYSLLMLYRLHML